MKTFLSLQEWNRLQSLKTQHHFVGGLDCSVALRCIGGEGVFYNRYIGQMIRTKLNIVSLVDPFMIAYSVVTIPVNSHVMIFISYIFPQSFLDVIIDSL